MDKRGPVVDMRYGKERVRVREGVQAAKTLESVCV